MKYNRFNKSHYAILDQLSVVVKDSVARIAKEMNSKSYTCHKGIDSLSQACADYRFDVEVYQDNFIDCVEFANKLVLDLHENKSLINFRISNVNIDHSQNGSTRDSTNMTVNLRWKPDNDPDWVVVEV